MSDNNSAPVSLDKDSNGFVHLHLHSQYSLLDGAIKFGDLFERARQFGMSAVACTDHGNMFGAIDFYLSAKKAGIKPIIGCELYFTSGSRYDRGDTTVSDVEEVEGGRDKIFHMVLLCKNNTGYQNLCKIVSSAYLEGFYYKPRADYDLLRSHSEGLICSTACLAGEVNHHLLNGRSSKAESAVEKLRAIFGEDLYLEIQDNGIPEQKTVNQKLVALSQKMGIKLVATNDCHYMNREDAAAQEVLLCIQTQKTLSDEKRMKFSTDELYFKSGETMRSSFAYIKERQIVREACDNTLLIADQCNVELKWTDEQGRPIYLLPDFEIKTEETTDQHFAGVARLGLEKRFRGPHFAKLVGKEDWEKSRREEYIKRLDWEIDHIVNMGFSGYFLIVADFITWAKERDIPVGPGRGSGAGSLVAYAMGITNIDPLPFNLFFERFINPERISMPDFDIDFCQTRRGEVIDYVTQKYGADKVCQIITFGKLQAKAVIRDVARVYSLPYAEADMLAKLVPDELGITLDKALEIEPKLQDLIEADPKIRQIFSICSSLEGLFRHASIHAAGVIITDEPLVNYCPLYSGRDGERVCQFDKNFAETVGLVKFDFLGLKTLTVVENAVKFIRRDLVDNFDIEEIDFEDSKVYEFISTGHTGGVFQLESSGMVDLCKRIRPDNLEDVTAINALFRPGPLERVSDFIELKHGRKEMNFPFPELEKVLKDTYGVIIYQEQVMDIARIIGGYTLGMADMLRRAMSKKKVEEMDRHRRIFCDGAEERGFDRKKAEDLYELMASFAAYGFNKSHAVAYAFIAYQTAFLKYYYPPQFFAALLSTEINNTDKITAYIDDAKKFKIAVLPPDINESLWPFNVVGKNIRFGMGAVKNVGESAVTEVIQERERNGPFKGFIDFCERINHRTINKRVMESLIKVGAFDSCEKMNRKTILENLEIIIAHGQQKQKEREIGQGSLFELPGMTGGDLNNHFLALREVEDFSAKEKLAYEAQLMGIYVSGHPLDRVSDLIGQLTSSSIAEVHKMTGDNKRDVVLGGIVTFKKNHLTKKGDRMCFATLEDQSGKIECVVFPSVFAESEELLEGDAPLIVTGQVNLAEEARKLLPGKIQKLKDRTEEKVSGVRINLRMDSLTSAHMSRLKQDLLSYRGSVPVHIIFEGDHGRARLPLGKEYYVNPLPQLAVKINQTFNSNSVKFIINGKLEDTAK